MFKAIGRWGSHVRSSIRIPFLSSLFGSKAKKYGDLDNEEEEIFLDAEEDIIHDTDDKLVLTPKVVGDDKLTPSPTISESPLSDLKSTGDKSETQTNAKDICDSLDSSNNPKTSASDVTVTVVTHEHQTEANGNATSIEGEGHSESGEESEAEDKEDDDHHVNHGDTKKIMKTSKSSNGLLQNTSTSVFQKVHRRVNSYTQRQYAKFDNAQDDHNDNCIRAEESTEAACDDGDIETDRIMIKPEKKSKRRKKIAKRTQKAVRGSWKWFKRSMVAYALTFNVPSLFVLNVASATRK